MTGPLLLACGALACGRSGTVPTSQQPAVLADSDDQASTPGEPVDNSILYEFVRGSSFRTLRDGSRITMDGQVLRAKADRPWEPDTTWEPGFRLDAEHLAAIRAELDATDVEALRQTTPTQEWCAPRLRVAAELRFVRQGKPVVVRVADYTAESAPAIAALAERIDAITKDALRDPYPLTPVELVSLAEVLVTNWGRLESKTGRGSRFWLCPDCGRHLPHDWSGAVAGEAAGAGGPVGAAPSTDTRNLVRPATI